MAINIRTHAADILEYWQDGRHYADSLINRWKREEELSPEDRNLLNALVIGVIRNQSLLDHFIAQLREGKIDMELRNVLRIGIFQILFMGVADHAAVNETVEGTRKGLRGLVNAVLRRTLREKEELLGQIKDLPLQVQFSHPKWLCQRWEESFTPEQLRDLLEWNQTPTTLTFRINSLVPEAQEIVSNSPNVDQLEDHPEFYRSLKLPKHEWMDQGYIYIQDPATQHAVNLLDPKEGETILDACAAPGGKSTQIAAAMSNKGKLLCTDSNPKRIPRLLENLENLNVKIAETEVFDWTEPAPEKWHNQFDGILLDVPCSNTGVLRKRIDARWRMTPESFTQLRELQLKILSNALPCVKVGGRIVYSTCSIDAVENKELIKQFLIDHPEFELTKEQQIYPFEHQTDGAYAAVLTRKS
ncbi:MAG: 16S rRNA (cytosine967-C5)-methyltransferase [Rubritalea sp.]|jgi:16S rRNA (cytosine967-C5)-methyltransferase